MKPLVVQTNLCTTIPPLSLLCIVPFMQLLAEALMALLPGIDANDEHKTMAVMHLYTSVLSSLPLLAQAGGEEAGKAGGACVYVK